MSIAKAADRGQSFDLLLRGVIELNIRLLDQQARFVGIMGRILGPMIAYSYKPPPEIERLYQELRDRILPMFERDGAAKIPVKTGIEAAEALGRGGDPSLERDTLIGVPDTDGVSLGKYTDSACDCLQRGGSWGDSPLCLRSAFFRWNSPGVRDSNGGFRVSAA